MYGVYEIFDINNGYIWAFMNDLGKIKTQQHIMKQISMTNN